MKIYISGPVGSNIEAARPRFEQAARQVEASKVLRLRKMADELGNEGIAIIEEAYIPTLSKTYIRAEYKADNGMWQYIPLGMTEA